MAQKALAKIQEAEAEAERIRSGAVGQAEALRSDAHARGKTLLAENTAELKEMRRNRLAEADAQVALIVANGTKSAHEEADRLTSEASGKLDAATALILERIRTLWQ